MWQSCIAISASQREKEIWLFLGGRSNSFQRTVNADEFIKHSSCPNHSFLKLHLEEKRKKISHWYLCLKSRWKCCWRLYSKCTAINGENIFEEWCSVLQIEVFYELPYNGMPRTGTYLSSHTSVCSALEYSNILPVSSEITDGALQHFQSTASFNMLCEEGGFLRRE